MRTRTKYQLELIIFLLVIILIIVFVTINLDYFNDLISLYVQQYGLIAILVACFLLDFIQQPIGPDIPAALGVLFGLNIVFVILFAIIGSFLASLINFYIGKAYLYFRVSKGLEPKDYREYSGIFTKYGKWALFLAAISPVPWVAFCWLAGSFKMELRQFAFYGLIPRAVRILTIVLVVKYVSLFLVG